MSHLLGDEGLGTKVDCVCQKLMIGEREFLEEAHGSRYSIHPGATKMYRDLQEIYWWDYLKRDIADFVAR